MLICIDILIQLSTVSNFFPLEVVQKRQCCQLRVLRENSNQSVLCITGSIRGEQENKYYQIT